MAEDKTLMEIAENGNHYEAPWRDDRLKQAFLRRAAEKDVSVEEVLHWAAAHMSKVNTTWGDDKKMWIADEAQEMIALAIVKMHRGHATKASTKAPIPDVRGLEGKLDMFTARVG